MTFTYVATSGSASGTTSVTPPLTPSAEAGHLLVAVVDSGHPTAATEPSTPDGWLLAGTVVGTSGTYGVDTGPRRLSIYLRLASGGADDSPTFTIDSGVEVRVGATIFAWQFGAGESVQWAVGLGQDTSSGTGFSAVTTSTVGLAVDDAVQVTYVANTDAVTWSGQALSASGITFAAATELFDSSSSVGADVSRSTASSQVTAGTATGAVTMSATMSGAAIGVAGLVRLRDTAAGGTAAILTATYDGSLARVQLVASGLDAHADAALIERTTDGHTWTTVRGAAAAPVVGGVTPVPVDDYEWADGVATTYRVTAYDTASGIPTDITSTTVTPELLQFVWLKSTARPFLNTAVQAVLKNPTAVLRPARAGVFDVIGRSLPVAVSDVRRSRQWIMYVRTETYDEASRVDLLLASGDVLYVHVPHGCPAEVVPGGHVSVGDATQEFHPLRPESRLWTLPMVEVAAPAAEVVGSTASWATVLANYATWSDVPAAQPTWADVLTLVGDPTEVLVP